MGVENLQHFVEALGPLVTRDVDLGELSKSLGRPMHLLIDGETCLETLVGGFFSDDACGGQWCRTLLNLRKLIQALRANKPHPVSILVAFDGTVGNQKIGEWSKSQMAVRANVESVFKHIERRGTPPPKVWAVPPAGLRFCVIQILHSLNVLVHVTVEDHYQELTELWRRNAFDAVVGNVGEFFAFGPPRYFSGKHFKICSKGGCIVTKEYLHTEVSKNLGLPSADRLVTFVSLLGNHILTPKDLETFHRRLMEGGEEGGDLAPSTTEPYSSELVIRVVATRVARVGNVFAADPSVVAKNFFDSEDPRLKKLIDSMEYYLLLDKQRRFRLIRDPAGPKGINNSIDSKKESDPNEEKKEKSGKVGCDSTVNVVMSLLGNFGRDDLLPKPPQPPVEVKIPPCHREVIKTATEWHSHGLMSPFVLQTLTKAEVKFPVMLELAKHTDYPNLALLFRDLRRRVYAVLFNYHHHQYTATKMKQAEMAASKENKEAPKPASVTYVVPEMKVKEWVWSLVNPYTAPDIVEPRSLGWQVPTVRRLWFGKGPTDVDLRMQAFLSCMKAESLDMLVPGRTPLPITRPLFVLACVLRYIATATPIPLIGIIEVRAAIATALSRHLENIVFLRQVEAQELTRRGAQLAAAINFGLEMAAFANSACGAPIPHVDINPWVVFDGKLFQVKFCQATRTESLMELCEGNAENCAILDTILKQVFVGVKAEIRCGYQPVALGHSGFPRGGPSRHLLPGGSPYPAPLMDRLPFPFPNHGRQGLHPFANPRKQTIPSRGGNLEVAGIVVGHWEPNFSGNSGGLMGRNNHGGGGRHLSHQGQNGIQRARQAAKVSIAEHKNSEEGASAGAGAGASGVKVDRPDGALPDGARAHGSHENRELPRGMIKAPGILLGSPPSVPKPIEEVIAACVHEEPGESENGAVAAGSSLNGHGHGQGQGPGTH